MPVIRTQVSTPTTPAQRESLKAAFGKAVSAVQGKSEDELMCPFIDSTPIYFGGDDSRPAAYVEVNVKGEPGSVDRASWESMSRQIMAALGSTLAIPDDRIYIRFTATQNWGWKSSVI